jgi:hypothetical protein
LTEGLTFLWGQSSLFGDVLRVEIIYVEVEVAAVKIAGKNDRF